MKRLREYLRRRWLRKAIPVARIVYRAVHNEYPGAGICIEKLKFRPFGRVHVVFQFERPSETPYEIIA